MHVLMWSSFSSALHRSTLEFQYISYRRLLHFSIEVDLFDCCIPHRHHHGLGQCHIIQLWWAQGHSPPLGQGITQVRTWVTSRLIWMVDPWYQLDV